MTEFTLTLLDSSGIQRYIFDSNRLQENIGASELVYRVTTLWVFDVLEKNHFKHNIKSPHSLDWSYNLDFEIENHNDDNAVEVIYAAGGNAVLVFRKYEKAIEFSKAITLKVLQEAPGLILLAQHVKLDWENDRLSDIKDKDGKVIDGKRTELNKKIGAHKLSRLPSLPTLGLSVSAVCESTGLPAIGTNEKYRLGNDENRLVSRETLEKLANRNYANDRLEMVIGDTRGYKFPYDIDMLGRISGEESYVAVIHADGNHVGEHVQKTIDNKSDNRDYIKASRRFSDSMHIASTNALREVVKDLIDAIETDKNGGRYISGKVPLARKSNIWYLPFRPLVFGGDDVTFLANGQLGLSLASMYLEAFEKHTKDQKLPNMYASAGISIVKMHYPFARAYKLSEELTKNAKKFLNAEIKSDASSMDWHFAESGLSGSLDMIRQREYTIKGNKKLFMRPLILKAGEQGIARSWENIENAVFEFQKGEWEGKHNKVIGLREPLRISGQAVERYRQNFNLPLLPAILKTDMDKDERVAKSGWIKDRCLYFDVIELLDHHVSITKKQEV